MQHRLSRRAFLAGVACTPLARALSAAPLEPVTSSTGAPAPYVSSLPTRALRFSHLHTGERLSIDYYASGTYLPDALQTVNHFLRDFRTGEVHDIDANLLDLLHQLSMLTGTNRPFEVISGFRSPATNAMLRQRSEGVAAGSLHMKGQAIDIRLADIPLPKLRGAALAAARGGVGFYPRSNFVHVDTGRIRTW